jgi:putative ABC transport system permease protein
MNSVLRKFRRKPLRTFLTMLQIVLGALAMTLALSTYLEALQRQASKQPDRFDLVAGTKSESDSFGTTTYSMMDQKSVNELLELAPAVEKVAFIGDAWNSSTIERDGRLYKFQSAAYVNDDYFDLNEIVLTEGSLFTTYDKETEAAVMLISEGAARILFPNQSAVNQTFNIVPDEDYVVYDEDGKPQPAAPPEPFKIVGVFADRPILQNEGQHSLLLPTWRQKDVGEASVVNVLAKEGQGDEAREQSLMAARQVFSSRIAEWGLEKDETFFVNELGENMWSSQSQNLPDPTVVMFGLFGIVALIVGSIGIFSIMLVDALERERDTGIKRALGATKARITREMTLEATLIAGLGGLLGVLLAALVIPWLAAQVGNTLFWNTNLRWQPLAALIVFALTLILGMVLGFFPALRASSVKPVEALKGV